MKRQEKQEKIQELLDKIKNNSGIILTEYKGLNVDEISDLRSKLYPLNYEYRVVKNTLIKRALGSAGLEEFSQMFKGANAIAIGVGDPVSSSKVIVEFLKEHSKLKLKGGLLNNKILNSEQIKFLATLPSREVLLGQVASTLKSPIVNLVFVLKQIMGSLVYVLEAIKKQKEASNKI